jgi:hypothetical protein
MELYASVINIACPDYKRPASYVETKGSRLVNKVIKFNVTFDQSTLGINITSDVEDNCCSSEEVIRYVQDILGKE